MPYVKKTVTAGQTIFVKKYFSSRYNQKSDKGRAKKEKPTPEKQKKVNENNAAEYLTWLINANFKAGDYHIVLTYSDSHKPTPDEAADNLRRFLRKLRREYRKQQTELKYIDVTEYEGCRIHHHIIVNKFDTDVISSLWEDYGHPHFTCLDSSGEYSALASYLIKETSRTYENGTVSGKRYNSSRNLIKPQIEREIISADSWRSIPKPVKGYYIPSESIVADVDSFGYPYQLYTMIALSSKGKGKKTVEHVERTKAFISESLKPYIRI